jgi:hypothetical protein
MTASTTNSALGQGSPEIGISRALRGFRYPHRELRGAVRIRRFVLCTNYGSHRSFGWARAYPDCALAIAAAVRDDFDLEHRAGFPCYLGSPVDVESVRRGQSCEQTGCCLCAFVKQRGFGNAKRIVPTGLLKSHFELAGLWNETGRVEWRRIRVRPMASGVSALSGIVANSPRVMPMFPPPPLFIPYGGFSPVRLEAGLVILRPSATLPGCF